MARRKKLTKIRFVRVRRANKATLAVKDDLNIVLWDLDNLRIRPKYARGIAAQIKAYIKRHGYTGEVSIEAYSGMRGPPWKRVSEKVISQLRKRGSGVKYTRVRSTAKQATDFVMKKRIDTLIEQLQVTEEEDTEEEEEEDTDTSDEEDTEGIKANFFLLSSDAGFRTHMKKLNENGHHTFLVYDNRSIGEKYLRTVSADRKCHFNEFVSIPL